MSVQLARDLEAKFAQEDQIIREQADRDSKIARIHAERELEMMIAELDRSNEMVAKYLTVINKCLTGKSSGYDSFRLSQAQILWGLYHRRNIDYAFLIWEDFVYQVEHKNHKKSNEMYYPRFTKVIIHHFMLKDLSIPRRNKVNWHYVRDNFKFSTVKTRNTKAYKEYHAYATGEATPNPKASARRKRSELSWNSLDDEDADAQEKDGDDDEGDERDESDDGEKDDDDKDGNERDDDDDDQEIAKIDEQDDTERGGDDDEESESDDEDDDEEITDEKSFDPIPRTPEESEDNGNDKEEHGLKTGEEERLTEEEETYELYRDVGINQGRGIQVSQEIKDSHVTLTPVNPDGQQESSSMSSQFVSSMLNPISDAGVESIFETTSTSMASLFTPTPTVTPSVIATTTTSSQAPIPPTMFPSEILQHLLSFGLLFRFDERLKALEANFSEFSQINPFAEAVFAILSIVHQYINQQMTEAVRVAVQLQIDQLCDASQRENDEFLRTVDENIKKIIKEQAISPSSALTNKGTFIRPLWMLIKADKIILDTYEERVILKRRRDDDDQGEGPFAGSDRGSKRRREGNEPESASAPPEPTTRSAGRSTTGSKSRQASASESAYAEEPVQTPSQIEEPSHLVFETGTKDQPIVQSSQHLEWFSQPKVDTLTPKLLAGPTYELMKGSCKSLIELEYHLEEVYKAMTDQLDWVNPEGQQYPHNLLQPLSLIPDNRGHRVIPFAHFINNDLEYLRGGASSRKYTTSVTKMKTADYGHIKWIEDLFYNFAVNREFARDVYSKRRIIAVTDLKIVEWHSYKHLDWISVRRDDDKIYKFKKGDFKRLCLQDIEDMLLLLVQGKLSNLLVEERFAFDVSLRMFTRSIVIQRRMEDLQLRVESYQKRLNLTKPDIDETLTDVRTALDDRLKGIRMQYLPHTI
nr:hypothetical protein [Tanacetum cinerariifolium]